MPSIDSLQRAINYLNEALAQRIRAAELDTSTVPEYKAEAAALTRLADRNSEAALGAVREDLGLSNEL